jgi:two-component system sensor histidine kinase CiaH
VFQSATLKLTSWYLAILVAISLLFSIIIYSTASNEVDSRIGVLQKSSRPLTFKPGQATFNDLRDIQVREAEGNLLASLFITNLCIWVAGGIGSYYLARRTLKPIEEAHEAQSRFTSDASHELRTPLASMKTELEVALRDSKLEKDEMRELLVSNLEEVDKLTKLSQTLLQLSQLDHENIKREKVTLNTIATAVIERYDKSGKRVELTGNKSYNVVANKSSIEELLTILLDNALKYSPRESKVSITLIGQKQMAGFEVSNGGNGIPPEILPHIFDRFYRADTSRTGGDKRGYGLGLSLAKKIVELNNGELTVSSAPGHTTTFRILLPNFRRTPAKNQ